MFSRSLPARKITSRLAATAAGSVRCVEDWMSCGFPTQKSTPTSSIRPRVFPNFMVRNMLLPKLLQGPPLLFAEAIDEDEIVPLGSRRHLFFDKALVAHSENVRFRVNPPRIAECVMEHTNLGNHLVVLEGDDGLVQLYGCGPHKCLVVLTSKDGVHFEVPDLGTENFGKRNVGDSRSCRTGHDL